MMIKNDCTQRIYTQQLVRDVNYSIKELQCDVRRSYIPILTTENLICPQGRLPQLIISEELQLQLLLIINNHFRSFTGNNCVTTQMHSVQPTSVILKMLY